MLRPVWAAVLAAVVLAAAPLAGQAERGAGADTEAAPTPTVVWLVRHAERADDGPGQDGMLARVRDPELSSAGRRRAQALRALLVDVQLDRVLSTDYRRTRATADPVAAAHGLVVESYDPGDLGGLARRIGASGSHWLVVGHSNTTPDLVEALGGEPGGAIDEFEYDRLYQVVITGDGAVETTLLRFGG
jgi:broad specificity phosphatase PhoE